MGMLVRGRWEFSSSARAVAKKPSAIEDTDRFGGKEREKTNGKV